MSNLPLLVRMTKQVHNFKLAFFSFLYNNFFQIRCQMEADERNKKMIHTQIEEGKKKYQHEHGDLSRTPRKGPT